MFRHIEGWNASLLARPIGVQHRVCGTLQTMASMIACSIQRLTVGAALVAVLFACDRPAQPTEVPTEVLAKTDGDDEAGKADNTATGQPGQHEADNTATSQPDQQRADNASSPDETVSCTRYVQVLNAMATNMPPGYTDEQPAYFRGVAPPTMKHGWTGIPAKGTPRIMNPGAHIAIAATGEVIFRGAAYAVDKQSRKLAAALRKELKRRRNRGSSDGELALAVVGDKAAPLASLERAYAAIPAGFSIRWVVKKPIDALIANHMRYFPKTPRWVKELMESPGFSLASSQFAPAIIRAAGSCRQALQAFSLLAEGGGMDVLGPALAEALTECQCKAGDVHALVSLSTYVVLPLPDFAWKPLAFSNNRDAIALTLTKDATLDDLARAVTALSATQQEQPIRYTTLSKRK